MPIVINCGSATGLDAQYSALVSNCQGEAPADTCSTISMPVQRMFSTACRIARNILHFLLYAIVFLLLSGCARESLTDQRELSQHEAISTAAAIAALSIPEISGSQVAPYNIHAEKMTLKEAAKRLNDNPQNALSEESPDTQVWLVSMDGIWFPASVPGVVQKPFQHLSIVIDARTGLEIFRNIQP
jgi:hypothetical protein